MIKVIRHIVFLILLAAVTGNALGQFYNGTKMTFGKNRIQYYNFYWSYYRFDDFDCYFNEYGRELAQYTSEYANEKLAEIEDYFDYMLEKRLIFVVFNKQAEFKQTNIGLNSDAQDYNIGGLSRIIKNKVMLYYEGDHESYDRQISSAIANVLINEMLYDADRKNRISGASKITLPDWYQKGLVNYVAYGWDQEVENRVRDGILSGRYDRLDWLENEEAVYAGQSFWKYVADTYGDAIIPNVIYLTKIYKNVKDGLMYVLGMTLKDIEAEWLDYYRKYFEETETGIKPGTEGELISQTKKRKTIQNLSISPDQRYIAYTTYNLGKRKIFVYNSETGKTKKIFKKEPKYEQKEDATYPVMGWHPSSSLLTFISEEKGALKLYFYRPGTGKTESRNLLYFDKVLDFDFSPSGNRLVMSAVKDGLTDIFIHTIASGTNEQITRDIADDLNPSYVKNEKNTILFTSNRANDTLNLPFDPMGRTQATYDLFTYNLDRDNKVATRLTENDYTNRSMGVVNPGPKVLYLGDKTGTISRFVAEYDSAISFIDTTTHYRYFITSKQITNYNRDILKQDITPGGGWGEIVYDDGRYKLFTGSSVNNRPVPLSELKTSRSRLEKLNEFEKADSVEQIRQWLIAEAKRRRDTMTKPLYEYYKTDEPIDINHYIFEKEKQNFFEQQWKKEYMDIDLDTGSFKLPLIRIYEPSFYNNYIANRVDFSFLNNSYQAYTGGSPYFNPGLNMMTQIGAVDLFEDYRITGGFRFAGNFDSNEYLLSLESLKGKYDKQFIYHRQSLNGSNDTSYFKIHSNNVYLSLSRPLTPVLAIKGTATYRVDRYVPLSIDYASLNNDMFRRDWAGLKGEIIYDNTRPRGTNIYFGTRFKIFGEWYRGLQVSKSNMFVVGADFRHYLRIHRDLIWANRFAASSSFGQAKLLYYLGGVDNWMGFLFNSTPMFDKSIPVNQSVNYAFQSLATNMRGFSQNIRNGNNFAVINSEIRWPVVRYFIGHPVKSTLLNDFQIVLFGDLGSAWSGLTPWSGENEWDKEEYQNGPVKVTINTNRDPIVGGFGFGLRANLFGYFVRADWAWGVENYYILPHIFYLSFSLDF